MGFQYPPNPVNGQVVTTPGGVTFIWNEPAGGWIQSTIEWPVPQIPGDYIEWPQNPQMGDSFTTPAGLVFVYTGQAWRVSGSSVLPSPYFLAGVGPPPNILGMEGNFYLDVSTGELYGPYNAGEWPPPVDFAADEGPPGPQGNPGPVGPIGPEGPTGQIGAMGQQGNQGVPGIAGMQGPVGPQGVQGPPGEFVRIVGYFSAQPPSALPPNGYFPPAWDIPNNWPTTQYTMPVNGGLVYTPNQHVWIWVTPQFNPAGWVDLGSMGQTQGPTGPMGPAGPQGTQGVPGPQGAQGIAGLQGTQGIQGQQGPAGPAGPQGNDGAPGQTAILVGSFSNQPSTALPPSGYIPADWDTPGNPATAYQMELGQGLIDTNTNTIYTFVGASVTAAGWIPIGAVQGPPGPVGPAGSDGVDGAQGPPGVNGAQGVQGSEGPVGAQGIQGPPGPEGPAGQSGSSTILVGSFTNNDPSLLPVNGLIPQDWDSTGNPPAALQMVEGQSLLYTPTSDIYVWVGPENSTTGWILLGNAQGPEGPQGPPGADGAQGPMGPSGAQGVIGPVGPAGPQGATGPQGPQGDPGVPGIPDAPDDGNIYARQSEAWVVIPPGTTVVVQDYPPGSPNAGALWYNSTDLQMYIYYDDGTSSQWVPVIPAAVGGGATITLSDTAPTGVAEGALWYDTTQCQLYVFYNSQWVIAVNQLGAYLPISGGILTGNLTIGGTTTLSADPVQPLQAATKEYVDNSALAVLSTGAAYGGFINKIRNPGMDVWQRGNVTITTAGGYCADGWVLLPTGASCATLLTGKFSESVSSRSMALACASGITQCQLQHRIESFVAGQLAGQRCTFQALVNNATAVPLTLQLQTVYFATVDVFSSYVADLPTTNLQTIPAGQVGIVSYTLNVNPLAANGYAAILLFGAGLNAASGSVLITDVDFRITPNVPIGLNSSPPPVEIRPIAIEFVYCQRYFCSVGGYGTFFCGNATSGGLYYASGQFPVPMRVIPSVVFTNTGGLGFPTTVGAFQNSGTLGILESRTCNATTTAGFFGSSFTASAEL